MNIEDKTLLAKKKVSEPSTVRNRIVFIIALIFSIVYQLILLKWESSNDVFYDLGVMLNTIALSIVTGYIFHYITFILPSRKKAKTMLPIIKTLEQNLSKELICLISLLTEINDWTKYNDNCLKNKMKNACRTRKIWVEEYEGIYPCHNLTSYNPKTLDLISSTLSNITKSIDDFIINIEFITDINYLERILWFRNSSLYNKLLCCHDAAEEQKDEKTLKEAKYQNSDTFLDEFFREELVLRLFIEDKDKKSFISEVRKLIEYGI